MYFNPKELNWRISTCGKFSTPELVQHNIDTSLADLQDISSISSQQFQKIALENLTKLVTILSIISTWEINKRSFRIPSNILPYFENTKVKGYYYQIEDKIKLLLTEAGNIAKNNNIRLSTHPNQWMVLGSNKSYVVQKTIEFLATQSYIGKNLGISPEDFAVNIHLQGRYGEPAINGINRFATNFKYLDDYMQKALTVENEDKPNGFDIEHTIELSKKIPIRCCFDIHHYSCYRKKIDDYVSTNNEFFIEAVKTWGNIRPLFHKSQTKPEGRAINIHSDYYYDQDLMSMAIPLLEYADFDVEAKLTDLAVNSFYEYIKAEEEFAGENLTCKTF